MQIDTTENSSTAGILSHARSGDLQERVSFFSEIYYANEDTHWSEKEVRGPHGAFNSQYENYLSVTEGRKRALFGQCSLNIFSI